MQTIVKILVMSIVVLGFVGMANADIEALKIYKKAYPETKSQCMYCHVSKKPKKQDGQHELNAYGDKVKGLGELTEEKLLEIGSYEENSSGVEE